MKAIGGADLDRDLVQSFQKGEESAYDEIYGRYRDRVYSVCYRMLGRAPEAEEATQETFLRAYQALGRFNGNYYLGAWLSRIAANVCLDLLRARSRTNLVALPDDIEALETEPSPEDVVVGEHPRLEAAIGSIQPLHANALHLRAVQGLSHQEMAHHLAMTPSQVKALLHRARASLRRAWDRVEGMALVPFLYLRHLSGDRTGQEAGTGFLGVAPAVTPGLAERMAASAVIVVTALAGVPAPALQDSIAPSRRGRSVAASQGRASDQPTPLRSAAIGSTEGSAGTEQPPADGLLSEIDVPVPVPLPEEEEGERRRDREPGDDDPGDSGPPAHGADGVVSEVRQTAQEIRKNLTDG